MKTIWEFVEKYYPDYSGSEDIAREGDLTKIIEGEWEAGDCAYELIISEGVTPHIAQVQADDLRREIYEKAIQGFLDQQGGQ